MSYPYDGAPPQPQPQSQPQSHHNPEQVARTIYIKGIDSGITDQQLLEFFSYCGPVTNFRLCGDINYPTRFAFFEFQTPEAASAALSLSGAVLGRSALKISPSKTAIQATTPKTQPVTHKELIDRTIYVGNVDVALNEDHLQQFFEATCGPVTKVVLAGDTLHAARFAFVEFLHPESRNIALKLGSTQLGTRAIRVNPSSTPILGGGKAYNTGLSTGLTTFPSTAASPMYPYAPIMPASYPYGYPYMAPHMQAPPGMGVAQMRMPARGAPAMQAIAPPTHEPKRLDVQQNDSSTTTSTKNRPPTTSPAGSKKQSRDSYEREKDQPLEARSSSKVASNPIETKEQRQSRYRGCLLGMAVGDAIGATVEFMTPGSFTPVVDMVGGGPFDLAPGEWTDDTSMALCIAESLIERKDYDPANIMDKLVKWWKEGHLSSNGKCFDIGNQVKKALGKYLHGKSPYCGSPDSRGNSSIVRLAPVALFFAHTPEEAIEQSADSSKITHTSKECVDACRYLAALIVGAIHGSSKEELLSDSFTPVPGFWRSHPLCSDIREVAAGSFKRKEPPQIEGSEDVARALEAALWAFYTTDSFEEGCLKAVNLGDDADTTAAIYGQIAGAYYSEEGIPERWRDKLATAKKKGGDHTTEEESVASFADKLFVIAENRNGGSGSNTNDDANNNAHACANANNDGDTHGSDERDTKRKRRDTPEPEPQGRD